VYYQAVKLLEAGKKLGGVNRRRNMVEKGKP